MPTPENTNYATFTGDGVTAIFVMDTVINKASDLTVYLDQVLQTSGYTVTIDATARTATITFSTAPSATVKILSYRLIASNINPIDDGSPITNNDLNTNYQQNQLTTYDNTNQYNRFTLRYPTWTLEDGVGPSTAQLEMPLPTNPETGESNYVMAWDGTQWVSEENNAGNKTAAELETELASSTTGSEGSAKIGYSGDSSTVEGQLDIFRAVATGPSASGATYINLWHPVGGGSSRSIQSGWNNLFATATAVDTGYLNDITVWDATRTTAVNVGEIITQVYGIPTATNGYGAGIIKFWDGAAAVAIQSGLDYVPLYQVGAHIPGYLFTPPRAGTWHTISPTQTLAKTTGTFTGTTYQALYQKLATEYLDKTARQAYTDWNNDVAITPSSMTATGGQDHSIPGINTYRIA